MKRLITSFFLLLLFALTHAQNQAAFKSIGKKQKVYTLSNDRFDESFINDSIQQIGSVVINAKTGQIIKLLAENEIGTAEEDLIVGSRFLSVDALTASFPMLTPYQYASNTPIQAIDLDGLEAVYYYSGNPFTGGFSISKNISGPYSSEYLNKLGYFTAEQVNRIEYQGEVNRQKEKARQDGIAYRKAIDGLNFINITNNPGGLALMMSPAKGLYDAHQMYREGSTTLAAVTAVFAFTDFAPLFRTFGKAYAGVATSMAAKYTIEKTWELNPLIRGILVEARLATEYIAKGFEWMAETSQFWRKFDFYSAKEGLAVSLKSVNAEKNFDFTNIITNIKELAELRKAGTSAQFGKELVIKEVRLDIAVPKGYTQSNLNKVIAAGKQSNVEINIIEH